MWRKERQIKQLLQLFNLDNPRDKIRVFYRVGIIMKKRGLKSRGKKAIYLSTNCLWELFLIIFAIQFPGLVVQWIE